jgi:hypothetical protein
VRVVTYRRGVREHVDGPPAAALHGLLHGRLESVAGVDRERGVPYAPDVTGRKLEVVRLGPRWCEVHHLRIGAGNLPGGECEGVEGRDDRVVARGATAARECRHRRREDAQENDSRNHHPRRAYQTMRIAIV